jgi:membrane protein DedA with SNARE-associated domain
MERDLIDWLVRYGAPLLFFAQVLGIVGVPIPDELLLTVAGALVAKGLMSGPWTLVAAIAGCLAGITVSYAIGRTIGITILRRRFERHGPVIDRAQAWFRRFGGWLLTFGYFIPGVRHVTAISAGSGCLDYREFAAYAYPGGALWCLVFLSLGYFAGDRSRELLDAARSHSALAAILAVSGVTLYALVRFGTERTGSRS